MLRKRLQSDKATEKVYLNLKSCTPDHSTTSQKHKCIRIALQQPFVSFDSTKRLSHNKMWLMFNTPGIAVKSGQRLEMVYCAFATIKIKLVFEFRKQVNEGSHHDGANDSIIKMMDQHGINNKQVDHAARSKGLALMQQG